MNKCSSACCGVVPCACWLAHMGVPSTATFLQQCKALADLLAHNTSAGNQTLLSLLASRCRARRGIATAMDIDDFSVAVQWRPFAEAALRAVAPRNPSAGPRVHNWWPGGWVGPPHRLLPTPA